MESIIKKIKNTQIDTGSTNTTVGWYVDTNGYIDNTTGLGGLADLPLKYESINLDLGGGKFNNGTEFLLRERGVENHVFDPYNRSLEHNSSVQHLIKRSKFDTVTSISVLNVIGLDEPKFGYKSKQFHIMTAYNALKSGGTAYFKIWEGDKTGNPGIHCIHPEYGWQMNIPICDYLSLIGEWFDRVSCSSVPNLIIAHKK